MMTGITMPLFDFVSVPAFALAFFIHMMMGMIWYHPKVFGTAFLRLAHNGRMPKPDATALKMAAGGSAIAMPFFAFMLSAVACRTAGEGSLWGLMYGLFMDSGLNVSHSFFEGRPFELFVLHRGYHALSLALIGAVLGAVCGQGVGAV